MRRIILASTLFLAGCATRPQPAPEQPSQPVPQPRQMTSLAGMSAQQLVGHLGAPALQIREGTSLKLQFRGRQCVLDAYLYPQNGELRVTHIDARTPAGTDADQAACILALENPS
jgi:hypothetical protein